MQDLVQDLLGEVGGEAFCNARDTLRGGVPDDGIFVAKGLKEGLQHGLGLFRHVNIVFVCRGSSSERPFGREGPPFINK